MAKILVDGLERPGTRAVEMDFPSNSKNRRNEELPEKKIEKIITGKVIERKKGLGRKFSDIFLGGDSIETVISHIVVEVIIPSAKDMIYDTVMDGLKMSLFGTVGGGRRGRSRDSNVPRVSYSNYSKTDSRNDSRSRRDQREKPKYNTTKSRHDFNDIILESKGEALEVIANLVDLITEYEVCSVSDLYGFVGIPPTFADDKWGWDNLSSAKPVRVAGGGYLLDLPKPIVIN